MAIPLAKATTSVAGMASELIHNRAGSGNDAIRMIERSSGADTIAAACILTKLRKASASRAIAGGG
ncbi:MAG: hypothetical protein HUU32_21645 [Calditrichaceae bacterium]|nr:hypothetical protein [Calditrichia bacterium]NUQ44000.1 hypothetical protein [Calditrichaceae bacterium]